MDTLKVASRTTCEMKRALVLDFDFMVVPNYLQFFFLFSELHLHPNQTLVVTYEHTILVTNLAVLNENNITKYSSKEANQRVIKHIPNLTNQINY